jgi:hypothetical protein
LRPPNAAIPLLNVIVAEVAERLATSTLEMTGIALEGVWKVITGTAGAPEAHGMKLYWVPGVKPVKATEWLSA